MRITTKGGDRGSTSLLCGKRVSKDNAFIEIYGTLDELNSFLGLAKSLSDNRRLRGVIDKIQKELFMVGADITGGASGRRVHGRITRREIESLDSLIEKFGRRLLSKGRSFVIPGKNTLSAIFDVARAITRRAERRVVALKRKRRLRNKVVIVYLNRLSDLLFLIARYSEKK